jgi:iron complex transport system ATP-binding protein
MTAAAWTCEDVTVHYPGARSPALDGITLSLTEGACTIILGPNGSGKSTLLRALLGRVPLVRGTITCFGASLPSWQRVALARAVGVVPQGEHETFPLTTRSLVAMGRYPHLGRYHGHRQCDGPMRCHAVRRAYGRYAVWR